MSVRFQLDIDRTLAAMVYIASKDVSALDTYKMCKLVFLSDKLHVVRFGRPITGDELRAMDYGPVPSAVYDALKAYVAGGTDNERIRPLANKLAEHLSVDASFQYPRFQVSRQLDYGYFLSTAEIAALDEVIEAHGNKSFDELYALTHAMPSYKNAWEDPERSSRNPLMSFEDLFENDSNALAGTKDEMLEDFEMRQALLHASI